MAGKGKGVDWGKLTGGATMQEVAKEAAIDKPKTKAKDCVHHRGCAREVGTRRNPL